MSHYIKGMTAQARSGVQVKMGRRPAYPLEYEHMKKNGLRRAMGGMVLIAASVAPAASHDLDSYKRAGDQFADVAARVKSEHRMPSWSDPAAATALRVLTDYRRFLDAEKYTVEDIEALLETCNTANRTSMSYFLFGLDAHLDKSMKDDAGKVMAITMQVASRNVIRYQEEMIPVLVFQQRCFGAALPLLSAFMAALPPDKMTPERLAGLAQMRRGLLTSYMGAAKSASETIINAANRHMLFDTLALMSPVYAQALDLPTRRQVRDHFRTVEGTLPQAFLPYVKKIGGAMESPACTGLCLL